jgi:hypothetical protein
VFTFEGSGPALTAHGSLDLKQEIQIQIQISDDLVFAGTFFLIKKCFTGAVFAF